MKLTKNQKHAKAARILLDANPIDRITACRDNFPLFLVVYFNHFITAPFADFHYDVMKDLADIENGNLYEYALVAFRFCAKTSIVKAWLTWIACFKKRNYVVVTSYDETNSENILNTVAHNLTEVGNKLLYDDMLFLYKRPLYTKERAKDEVTTKTKGMFQLSNGIWFESGSVNTVFRGRNSPDGKRIDLVVMDDIENTRTVASIDVTMKIRKQMDELRSAGNLLDHISVVYLGNKISKHGNVAFLEECEKTYPKFKYKEIPLISDDGEIAWKAFTPEKIKELREQFADTFNAEFLMKPDEIEAIFKPSREELLACIEYVPPAKDRVVIGMDTGKTKYLVVGDTKGLFINEYCDGYEQLEYYLNKYPDSQAVLDAQGDPTATKEMQLKYPGRVFACRFQMDRKGDEMVTLYEDEPTIIADRNRLISWTYDEFSSQRTTLYGEVDYWDDLYIKHWTNMYRTTKMTSIGQRRVWERKGGDHENGDHLALATVYWRAGVQVLRGPTVIKVYDKNGNLLE